MKLRDIVPRGRDFKGDMEKTDDPFHRFRREFQQLAENFWNTDLPDFFGDRDFASPAVDVHSDKDKVYVTAELPGVDEKDLELTLEQNHIVISGEKKNEFEEKKKGSYRLERSYGSFRRVVPLGHTVKENEATATFKNGVLKIEIPRTEDDKKTSLKIPIHKE